MIISKNPYTNTTLKEYHAHTQEQVEQCIIQANQRFEIWKGTPLKERAALVNQLADLLFQKKQTYAELMAQEMGKPVTQGRAEIEKCIWLCDFYTKNGASFLADELIETEASESFISYDPLGVILAVMPWNFPFWQVMRFAVPTLMAGNTALLKHASNVTGCAMAIEALFKDAGFPEHTFTTVLANHDQVEYILAHDFVKGVSVTGSGTAGKAIAAIAGKHLKTSVMELGGNNACIVWEDADLDKYMDTMVNARMQNTGQSCIAAKRFIIVDSLYDKFVQRFKKRVSQLRSGDPMDEATEIGVLAREDLADTLADQVTNSVHKGAAVTMGNAHEKAYYEPTVLEEVLPGMPAFDEELFGPVAAMIKAKDREDSIVLASNSSFGLGSMLFTKDIKAAKRVIGNIPDGAFFINEMVKSDPRLPFGGTKMSGYGRELSKEGIHEFVNKKTVYINS